MLVTSIHTASTQEYARQRDEFAHYESFKLKNTMCQPLKPWNRVVKPMFWVYNWTLHAKYWFNDTKSWLTCLRYNVFGQFGNFENTNIPSFIPYFWVQNAGRPVPRTMCLLRLVLFTWTPWFANSSMMFARFLHYAPRNNEHVVFLDNFAFVDVKVLYEHNDL